MRYKISLILIMLMTCLQSQTLSQGTFPQNEKRGTIDLEYRALQPGEIIKVVLKGGPPSKLAQIHFLGRKIYMAGEDEHPERTAFLGLDLELAAGQYALDVVVAYEDGTLGHFKKNILVEKKEFPERKLWVNEKYVTPPAQFHERIRRESALMGEIYEMFTPRWLGEGEFITPCDGDVHDNFGERRIFNNKPRSPHSGLDISAPSGTPVRASNSGRIVLASELYFAGKTVIIDHGLGVFSLYCHFSRMLGKRGASVIKGEIIGEVGATGRVTGPHLHWGVKVLGNRVDPQSLLILVSE